MTLPRSNRRTCATRARICATRVTGRTRRLLAGKSAEPSYEFAPPLVAQRRVLEFVAPEFQSTRIVPQSKHIFGVSDDKRRLLSDLDVGVAEALITDPGTGLFPPKVVAVLTAFTMAGTVILGDPLRPTDEEVGACDEGLACIFEDHLWIDPNP